MRFTAQKIADFLGGIVEGDAEVEVSNVSKIEEGVKETLSFLANPKYENYLYTTGSSIVLINDNFKLQQPVGCTLIRVPDAYKAFASLLELYNQAKPELVGIDEQTNIDPLAKIGENVYVGTFSIISKNVKIGNNVKIHPQVYIGENAIIDDNTILFPGVKIYHDCQVGKNCIIHSGSVIGSDGFGFAPQTGENHKKIPQIGNVIIEDFVEIGANCTIDRATMGSTKIKEGAKLDNLVQIAHNVEIGERTFIAAQTGFAGSSKIGKDCLVGGQAGFAGHITIADKVKIGAQSGISKDIKIEGSVFRGSPALKYMDYQKSSIVFKSLPELRKDIMNLKKEIEELKKLKANSSN